VGVLQSHVVTSFSFEILFILFGLLLKIVVYLNSHLITTSGYEDSFALAAGFWLADEHHFRVVLALFLGHESTFNQLLAFLCLLLAISLDVVEVGGVDPSSWEEIIIVRKSLLEAL